MPRDDEELESFDEEDVVNEVIKEKNNKVQIDYSLDPIERIKLEISATDDVNQKQIGQYLLNKFETDEVLKNCYKDRKITLDSINNFVVECAKKHLNNKNGYISDEVVFGWVVHFVQDEKVSITDKASFTLTKEDENAAKERALKKFEEEQYQKIVAAEQKKKDAERKKLERAKEKEIKEKEEREQNGEISLFDFDD